MRMVLSFYNRVTQFLYHKYKQSFYTIKMALEYGLRVFLSKGGCEMGHEWGTQNHLLKMKIASGVTLKRLSLVNRSGLVFSVLAGFRWRVDDW